MTNEQHSPEDVALSLTLAVVASSPAPLLLLDSELVIVAASTSFCTAFGANPNQMSGKPLYGLDEGGWDSPQLQFLMAETLSGGGTPDACDMDLQRGEQPVQHLIVQARRLAYLDLDQVRILMAVSDITQSRADTSLKDDAIHKVQVLLQEVRHRVANSLQIIASVLLRNARTTTSAETRDQLENAHNRVMSVAALERLLSKSEDGDIEVHAYFTRLCENLSASMIGEPKEISLVVEGGVGVVEARVAVSLGLIVTELVLNALKYAFPDGRHGKISVDYTFRGPNWILCVEDDGIGMPASAPKGTGLGTSIVAALAAQLNASVEMTLKHPGTQVSIKHDRVVLVDADSEVVAPVVEMPLASNAINR